MLYVQSRKSLLVRREKKLISLPSAKKHSAKKRVCRVPKKTLGCTCKLGSFYLISEIICRAGQVTRLCWCPTLGRIMRRRFRRELSPGNFFLDRLLLSSASFHLRSYSYKYMHVWHDDVMVCYEFKKSIVYKINI